MPKRLEKRLRLEAAKKFPGDKERQNAYIYGTLQKVTNWRKPKNG